MSIDRDIIKDSGLCFGVIIIKMKGSKFMCASPASTAVCMGMEHRSVVSPGGRVLDKRKLLDRQRIRVSETHQGRTHEYHYNRNGEHSRDGRHQRACVGHTTSATKNMSTVGKAEQDLSAIIPTSHLSHHPKSSVSNEMMVVMRVSLHCKSCAGKVRKHISKMEGVTSFIIELEQKKVTVMGNVSPMEVLESISKVKNAEFWPTSNNF